MKLDEALYLALSSSKIPKNNKNITLDDVVLALTIDEHKFAELLGYSASGDGGFKNFRKKLLPNKPIKMSSYIRYILSTIRLQKCCNCKVIKPFEEYYNNVTDIYLGIDYRCKLCESLICRDSKKAKLNKHKHYIENKSKYIERNIKRKYKEKLSIVPWSETKEIKEFYKNCPEGYHVDHIIPIQGDLVSGLHVLNNLQYLTAQENLSKSNKYSII
jgi:hypothetical protein